MTPFKKRINAGTPPAIASSSAVMYSNSSHGNAGSASPFFTHAATGSAGAQKRASNALSSVSARFMPGSRPPNKQVIEPAIVTSPDSVEGLLKRRVKEIKEAFKQIDDRQKVRCAEEVLQLLRTRAREFPVASAVRGDDGGTLLMGNAGSSSLVMATGSGSTDLDTFPSFVISERKRKSVGTYRCRICRKEGHNSRSCDFPRPSPILTILNGSGEVNRSLSTAESSTAVLRNDLHLDCEKDEDDAHQEEKVQSVAASLFSSKSSSTFTSSVLASNTQANGSSSAALGNALMSGSLGKRSVESLPIDEDMIRDALLRPSASFGQ
jgi:hypothetical protein